MSGNLAEEIGEHPTLRTGKLLRKGRRHEEGNSSVPNSNERVSLQFTARIFTLMHLDEARRPKLKDADSLHWMPKQQNVSGCQSTCPGANDSEE